MRAVVLRAAGTNCEAEACRGLALAGAVPELVHLDRALRRPGELAGASIIVFPGGFSYGDDVASGRVFAVKVRQGLYPALRDAVVRGTPILGICNGFQVLAQCGLLPGPAAGEPWPERAAAPSVALTDNAQGRYVDRWVGAAADPGSPCVWTRSWAAMAPLGSGPAPAGAMLPVGHGEGRVFGDAEVLVALAARGQAPLRYRENPNGSALDIAGLCDGSGLVFGLMPHPDRYLDWTRHPFWTRLDEAERRGPTPGAMMFRDAVASVRGEAVAGLVRSGGS